MMIEKLKTGFCEKEVMCRDWEHSSYSAKHLEREQERVDDRISEVSPCWPSRT